ncbi:small ribosomal subunit protein bS21c isoform X2 [Lycium ferocissimum]|uniref:small ribosomal subunit protein bS21c isoform X1 n=1 Tax=Lycium ferocissimum TaxID=112874 RepID=UPI0028165660|nr:small ribosomal subunit protein bS21c isoform X1 [Lycium ferocissimum]XP_059294309.1 small ribosomal subunit protein bS21c isoform X2 [Lycium ferocissimum]
MAVSSIANLFSFFTPSKPPPTPKIPFLQFSVSSSSKPNQDGFSPLQVSSSDSDVTSVVYPSLANANTLFFRSAYNVQVIVDDNEHEERLIGRFRREVMRAGVIQECKRRRYFENSQDEKKRRTRDAAKRNHVAHHHQEVSDRISKRQPRARGTMMMKITGNFLMEVSPIEINFQIFFRFGSW